MTYLRSKNAPDASGAVQWSNDATSWSGIGVSEEVVEDFGSAVLVRARVPTHSAHAMFVRLTVSE